MKTRTVNPRELVAWLVLVFAVALFSASIAFAQDKKKKDDGKVHINIIKEENGKKIKIDTTVAAKDLPALKEYLKEKDIDFEPSAHGGKMKIKKGDDDGETIVMNYGDWDSHMSKEEKEKFKAEMKKLHEELGKMKDEMKDIHIEMFNDGDGDEDTVGLGDPLLRERAVLDLGEDPAAFGFPERGLRRQEFLLEGRQGHEGRRDPDQAVSPDVTLPPGGDGQPRAQAPPALEAGSAHAAEQAVLAQFVVAGHSQQAVPIGGPQGAEATLGAVAAGVVGEAHEGGIHRVVAVGDHQVRVGIEGQDAVELVVVG